MRPYCGVIFNRKSGKIIKAVDCAAGYGMLKLWILETITKTRDALIFDKTNGKVVWYVEGTDSFPNIYEENLGHVDEFCPGLFEAFQD